MGIAPYKTFTFGGVSSSAYDVYLTGEGVFNAPERAVDILEIPGRNGAYALDQGRFKNIEVTYKAGIYDLNESNFATKVANLRNWLCSHIGYVRLEDDYNTGEYRMAIYKSGLEVEHEGLINGEFDITFNCKPQRWLTSGETASTVANNGTMSNPTLFESNPLLAVKGYGGIHFNGFDVNVQNVTVGEVLIADNDTWRDSKTYTFDSTLFSNGDVISVSGKFNRMPMGANISGEQFSSTNSNAYFTTGYGVKWKNDFSFTFTAGTNSTVTNTLVVTSTSTSPNVTRTWTMVQTIAYNASAGTITFSDSGSATTTDNNYPATLVYDSNWSKINISGNSTASALGNPLYIDLDIGEAYKIENNNVVSCNSAVNLGSQLPTLASGTNTFTYDNTITELKVTPRWWQV